MSKFTAVVFALLLLAIWLPSSHAESPAILEDLMRAEPVFARYTTASGQSIPDSTFCPVDFSATKTFDSHNAYFAAVGGFFFLNL